MSTVPISNTFEENDLIYLFLGRRCSDQPVLRGHFDGRGSTTRDIFRRNFASEIFQKEFDGRFLLHHGRLNDFARFV